jgi:ribonuclease HI
MTLPPLPPDAATSLQSLADALFLPDFDLLLVGDGSGTTYPEPAAWGCLAYDRRKDKVTLHAGTTSCGTTNLAELMPYVQALWHHHQDHGQAPTTPVQVVIVSDSELTVRCGNGRYQRKANASVWAALRWFEDNGYRITWRHVPRNSNAWSTLMDQVAGALRRSWRDEWPGTEPRQQPPPKKSADLPGRTSAPGRAGPVEGHLPTASQRAHDQQPMSLASGG